MSLLFGPLCTHGSGGGSAFNYAALFTSYEMTNGWCIDGSPDQSAFWEDAGGTTACTVSGTSPVGRIDDMLADSGGVGYVVQTTTGAKPVYYVDGNGVRWFRYGLAGGVNHYMRPAVTVNVASALTQVAVFRPTSDVSGNEAGILSTYDGGWGSGGYHRLAGVDGTGESQFLCDSGVTGIVAAGSASAPVIVVAKRSGTGTNQSTITTYNMAGELIATATGTQDANPANGLVLGYVGILGSGLDCAFQFVGIGAAISAEDEALVVADLVAKFSEPTPGPTGYPLDDDGTLATGFGFGLLTMTPPDYNEGEHVYTGTTPSGTALAFPSADRWLTDQAFVVSSDKVLHIEFEPIVPSCYEAGVQGFPLLGMGIIMSDGGELGGVFGTVGIKDVGGTAPQYAGTLVPDNTVRATADGPVRMAVDLDGSDGSVTIRTIDGDEIVSPTTFTPGTAFTAYLFVQDGGAPLAGNVVISLVPKAADAALPCNPGAVDLLNVEV